MKRLTHAELADAHGRAQWAVLWEHAIPLVKMTVGRLVRSKTVKGADLDDVLQQGFLAGWAAIKDWPAFECAFSTHVANRVRWALLEFLGAAGNHGIGSHVQRSVILSLEDSRDVNNNGAHKRGAGADPTEDDADDGSFTDGLTYEGVLRNTGGTDGIGYVPGGFADPAEEADKLQIEEAIGAALEVLTAEERDIVTKLYGIGCAREIQEEYVERTGIARSTLNRRLTAAKRKMAQKLVRFAHMNHGSKENVRDTQ